MNNQGTNQTGRNQSPNTNGNNTLLGLDLPQKTIMGVILVVALVAFELFNFDTTRYALGNLLGDVRFAGVGWATILAIAFCAIDFAGLARLFTPERGKNEPTAVWYLMGAWLLGATMNAVMTWWAISLTLLSHDFGNEVLSREQLLRWVPFFVATLVWLTRILFIGAISVAGEYMFAGSPLQRVVQSGKRPSIKTTSTRTPAAGRPFQPNAAPMHAAPRRENRPASSGSRINRRPPRSQPTRSGMKAPGRSNNNLR